MEFQSKTKHAGSARRIIPSKSAPTVPSNRKQQSQIQNILRSSGAQAKLTIGQPNDKYEQEADRVADQVMSMSNADVAQRVETGTVQPMRIQRLEAGEEEEELQAKEMPGQTPTVAPNLESRINSLRGGGQPLDSATRSFFEPRFGHDFSKVRVHTGSCASETAKSVNSMAFTLGNNVVFGSGHYHPATQSGLRLLGHELTHVIQQKKALTPFALPPFAPGLTHVVQQSSHRLGEAAFHKPTDHHQNSSERGLNFLSTSKAYVQRDVTGARDQLLELERRRAAMIAVTEREQRAGEQEALSSSQGALNVANDAVGSEIANVQTRILGQITVIESARARGFIRAITELNATGLDSSADYTAFGIAMGGNLLWALSGIVPMLPTVAFTIRGLGPFFQAVSRSRDVWIATVGVVGAMTAQFSAGLPSGTSTSGVKSAMVARLTTANSALCNHLRRRFYIILTDAIVHGNPVVTTDAQTYAAELEVGLSHALYGDIYAKRLNNGDLVNASAVEQDARNQLLHQYVAGSSAIDTHYIGSNDIGATRSASGANVVDDAIALLGGQSSLRFEPFELVANQVRTSAHDLGVTLINFDAAAMARILTQGGDVFILTSRWNPSVVFSGSPNRWMNPLHTSSIVECYPQINNEPYMQLRHIRAIDGVTLRASQMTSVVQRRGTRIWSMNKVWFQARGGSNDSSGFIQVTGIPNIFFIKYQVQD